MVWKNHQSPYSQLFGRSPKKAYLEVCQLKVQKGTVTHTSFTLPTLPIEKYLIVILIAFLVTAIFSDFGIFH